MVDFSEDVKKWMKMTLRKGPFYLYSYESITYVRGYGEDRKTLSGRSYLVIWKKDGKVRIGTFVDGMYCRYGVKTYGTLTGNTMAGFWQARAGMLDEREMRAMIDVANGVSKLPAFDPQKLVDLVW